ncbi:MAG: gluconate:H+ symporter, partial [Bacteroidota bacterium]
LVFVMAQQTKLPLIYVGLPMLAALSVTHGYLPPHPAPTALVHDFGADLGLTLLYGLIVAIPAIILAGPVYSRSLKDLQPEPRRDLFQTQHYNPDQLPGVGISLLSALLPVLLIGLGTLIELSNSGENLLTQVSGFMGHPVIAMLLSVLLALYTLGLRRGRALKDLNGELNQSIKNIAPILLIIAGAGALKAVLSQSGVSDYLAVALIKLDVSPLVLAWGMAALIRVCVGSATVAGLTTAGIILPLVQSSGASPELMVLATGAGSLMFSHVNDTGFWLFKEYFNLSIKDTLRSWSVMETIVSVVGLLGVLTLNALL